MQKGGGLASALLLLSSVWGYASTCRTTKNFEKLVGLSKYFDGGMDMRRSLVSSVTVLLLVYGLAIQAQISAPLQVKQKFAAMPEKAAEKNREGLELKPYFANHWYKGNTHCHSDTNGERIPKHGDGPPENTLKWYAGHDYDFIVFTDHNYWHEGLQAPDGLLYIKGEEITSIQYHVNALGIKSYIRPAFGQDKLTIYQRAIDDTLAQGGVPVINHPITPLGYIYPDDFKKLERVHHFEVRNMQPGSYNRLSDPLWDHLLTAGYVFYGMVTDDAHKFVRPDPLIGDPPGLGWIMVDAPELNEQAIIQAIREGRFYGSTGPVVSQYKVTREAIQIWIETGEPCRIDFIGAFGKVLHSATGDYAAYTPTGDELYVRVLVSDSQGGLAFMQPVFYK